MRSLWKDAERFSFSSGFEEGRDRCPYDPAKGYTGLLVGRSPDEQGVTYRAPVLETSQRLNFLKSSNGQTVTMTNGL